MSDLSPDLSLQETEALVTEEVDASQLEEVEPLAALQLPFSFAKRFKVLIESAHEPVKVYHTPSTELSVFAEVRRFLDQTFVLEEIEENHFEELLTNSFQRDSSAAKQLMEDLGNESDLLSLAEDLVKGFLVWEI